MQPKRKPARFWGIGSKRYSKSLDYLASHGKIQLSGSGQIGADQLQVGQLDGPVVALRVEEVHQRSAAVLVGISHRVADPQRLRLVLRLVGLEQGDVAGD